MGGEGAMASEEKMKWKQEQIRREGHAGVRDAWQVTKLYLVSSQKHIKQDSWERKPARDGNKNLTLNFVGYENWF